MKERFTYEMPSPTASALVGLSHRGSRVETHTVAAMRQPYRGPLGVFAVVEHNGDSDEIHYVYKDHLGSWTTITDAAGHVEQEVSFDAWGNPRNPDTWTAYTAPELVEGPMFDRGFTGHEHLNNFGLINMNGRMYDPVMSSFLSVDNYVQAPDFSQSFNRYAYCLNNPLRYTDPSGWKHIGAWKDANLFHDNWSASYSRHAYEPRDFGLKQLVDINHDIAWMEANDLLGGVRVGSDYTVDRKGYIENHGKNERVVDVLYTFECWVSGAKDVYIEIPIGTLEKKNTDLVEGTNGVSYTLDMYNLNDDNLSTELFEFLAANTDVEWSQTFIGQSNSGKSILSTSHDKRTEVGQAYLLRNGWTIRAHNHSHPYHDYPSQSDYNWAKTVHKVFPNAVLKIYYKNHYYGYDEWGPFVIPSYNSNVLKGVNVLDTKKP